MSKPVAIVVGVGAEKELGAALWRRFAAGGYAVVVARRTADKIEKVANTIVSSDGSAAPVVTEREGLVALRQGRHGGVGLRRPASRTTLGQIYKAVESKAGVFAMRSQVHEG